MPDTVLTDVSITGALTVAGAVTGGSFVGAVSNDLNGAELILDADADTSITADTDDQIDILISGADDFQFTANTFTALSGSTIKTNTIAETTAATGVTVDGLLIKDGIAGSIQAITGDGAITIASGARVVLSKGAAAAITIATPTATTHDGFLITVVSLTAQAHVITSATDGFNDKGASGTATFGGAIGDSVTLMAYQANWYVVGKVNITIA